ncbi:hypothetical protein ABZ914_03800 [Spirillospora sp. NPDC046719]
MLKRPPIIVNVYAQPHHDEEEIAGIVSLRQGGELQKWELQWRRRSTPSAGTAAGRATSSTTPAASGSCSWSGSSTVAAVVEDREHVDGAWTGPGSFKARVITLSGQCLAPNRLEMLRAKNRFAAAASPTDLVDLVVEEAHLTRRAAVRLTDRADRADPTDKGARAFTWTLTLTARARVRYPPRGSGPGRPAAPRDQQGSSPAAVPLTGADHAPDPRQQGEPHELSDRLSWSDAFAWS